MDIGHVTWRRSSYSTSNGGNCVEVGVWRKASYSTSNGGGCVEVMGIPAALVAVRDSKDPEGPKLVIGPGAWRAFTRRVKDGQFDLG
jgi:Domain of unknown function (DUF397)